MNTTMNNETQELQKKNKKGIDPKVTAAAAAGVAGAAVGAVGGAFLAGNEAEAAETETTTTTQTTPQTEQHPQQPAQQQPQQPAQQPQQPEAQTSEGPAPFSAHPNAPTSETTTPAEPETVVSGVNVEETVDVNDIAQTIVSGEEIDPTDIDAGDILNFASVGTVYGADGSEYNGALVQDAAGNEMVMVDIDNDGQFDVVTDTEGNLVAQGDTGIMVSDAELDVTTGYLAQDPTTDVIDAADTMMDDMITI